MTDRLATHLLAGVIIRRHHSEMYAVVKGDRVRCLDGELSPMNGRIGEVVDYTTNNVRAPLPVKVKLVLDNGQVSRRLARFYKWEKVE